MFSHSNLVEGYHKLSNDRQTPSVWQELTIWKSYL